MISRLLGAALAPAGVLAFVACAQSTSDSLKVPAEWIELSADSAFTVMAPPGTRFQRSRGIDSLTGSFAGPGFELDVDYGAYSDPLSMHRSATQYEVREVYVDGKLAKITTAHAPHRFAERPYFIGIHFPAVKQSAVGSTKLTLTCSLEHKQDYPLVETIYRTIRFK